jgi:hypothetical protein
MKKNLLFTTMLASALVSGCATQAIQSYQPFQPEDLIAQVKSGKLVQKNRQFFCSQRFIFVHG